jgi:transposase
MAQRRPWEVEDGLWELIEPLLPKVERRFRHPGRKRLDDRKALCGILFVLYTGIPWEFLPQELGYGSGMTCWRRLRDWHQAGVWQQLHEVLLARLNAAEVIDWSRAAANGSHVRALRGAAHRPPSTTHDHPGRPRPPAHTRPVLVTGTTGLAARSRPGYSPPGATSSA